MGFERGLAGGEAAEWQDAADPDAEAQYNLRRRHPERASVYEDLARRSAAFRAARGGLIDLPYGPGRNERLDLFPAAERGAPLLVFIHGGYWRALDKSGFSCLAEPYLDAGMAVAMLNYELAPAVRVGDIVQQVRRAIAFLVRSAAAHGHEGGGILVSGHSAGGHLTAMALATDWAGYGLDADPLAAGITISGLFDLVPLLRTSINDDVRLNREEAVRLSPQRQPGTIRQPLLLVVGGQETEGFRRQTLEFGALVRERGGEAQTMVRPGFNHFTILDDCADPQSPVFAEVTRLAAAR